MIDNKEVCETCNGTSYHDNLCCKCGGTGAGVDGDGWCHDCNGEGTIWGICDECGGRFDNDSSDD